MEKSNHETNREVVKEQILAIRDSGETNMLSWLTVQRLAYEREFYELVCFIEEQPKQYCNFIMSGDENLLPE